MDYRKFLGKQEELVLPYFGGGSVDAPGRRLRVAAPVAAGWWRFEVRGRVATAKGPAEAGPPDVVEGLPVVRGHVLGVRLVRDGAVAEPLHLLPEDEPPRLSPCKARRWHSGELIFEGLEFEGEAEEAARRALEDDRPLSGIKGVPASLRAAFGYAVAEAASRALRIPVSPLEIQGFVLELAEGGRQAAVALLQRLDGERQAALHAAEARQAEIEAQLRAASRREQAEALQAERARAVEQAGERRRQAAGPGRPPRPDNADDRVERALEAAGAELLETRRLAGGNLEVVYRFRGERFITIVNGATLQVIDAGVCLAGADQMVTLESLPSVIKEAIDGRKLVITRREGRRAGHGANADDDYDEYE